MVYSLFPYPLLTAFRFWAFLYVQHRHDIRKLLLWSCCKDTYSPSSTGAKLHHCNHPLLNSRDADDVGILRFHEQEWEYSRREGPYDCGCNPKCWAKLFLLFLASDRLHGLWCCQAHPGQDHGLCSISSSRTLHLRLDLCDCKLDCYSRECW